MNSVSPCPVVERNREVREPLDEGVSELHQASDVLCTEIRRRRQTLDGQTPQNPGQRERGEPGVLPRSIPKRAFKVATALQEHPNVVEVAEFRTRKQRTELVDQKLKGAVDSDPHTFESALLRRGDFARWFGDEVHNDSLTFRGHLKANKSRRALKNVHRQVSVLQEPPRSLRCIFKPLMSAKEQIKGPRAPVPRVETDEGGPARQHPVVIFEKR